MNVLRETRKRVARRVKHTLLAWIEIQGQGPDAKPRAEQGIARIVDLSPQGIGIVMVVPTQVGDNVTVELLLPIGLRLRAEGRVANVSPLTSERYRMGVQFDAPPVLCDVEGPLDARPRPMTQPL
jgi:hypothetical protein